MLLTEPPRSQGDLNFPLLGIPVRVHPLFWLVALLLGGVGREPDPARILIWIGTVFFSILVHELGHALAARRHGWEPRIVLYGMGGLATYQPTYHTARSQVLISLAGPFAGFALALVVVLLLTATGHQIRFRPSMMPVQFEPLASPKANLLVQYLLFINIWWGLINLCPLYPLDGGQIAREVLTEVNGPVGVPHSLMLSVATGVCLVAYGLYLRSLLMTILFGLLAYQSWAVLQAYRGRGGRGW